MVPNHLFPLQVVLKGVPHEVGTVGRTEYAHAFDLHHLVLQVYAALFQLSHDLVLAELY
jgi:hypothetical protein